MRRGERDIGKEREKEKGDVVGFCSGKSGVVRFKIISLKDRS